jgi:4-coumarate--CoA ligase
MQLEAHLVSHPKVLDAAVIGVEYNGTEAPRAYVVAKDLSEDDVKQWVKDHLATYKQLRGGVVFVETIPKSPSGKILRKDLRELAKSEQQAKRASKL